MRNDILNYLKRELVGPDPVPPHIQANGEEILLNEPPRVRYSAGVLFPSPGPDGQGMTYGATESTTPIEQEIIRSDSEVVLVKQSTMVENNTSANVSDDFEEEIGLSNNFLPSAMGFSCFSRIPAEGFKIDVTIGAYELNDYTYKKEDGAEVTRKAYFRRSLSQTLTIASAGIPLVSGTCREYGLKDSENKPLGLALNIRNRTHGHETGANVHLLTFTLINKNHGNGDNIKNEDCFFQICFSVTAVEACFCPYKLAASKTSL
jgi:hypothetical protein